MVSLKKLALACSFCSLFGGIGANSALAALPLEGTTLNVGAAVAPPFVSISESLATPTGLEIEIIEELRKRTGFKLKNGQYDMMNFGELMDNAFDGKVDIVAGGISLTESRAKAFDFSHSYYTGLTALVAPRNSDIRGFNDLDNKTIAAEAGSTASDLIPPEYDVRVTVDSTSTNFMAFYRVSRHLSDAIVTDEPLALAYILGWPESDLEIKTLVEDSDTPMGLLFKKNSPANKHLNDAMKAMVLDGTMDRLLTKYVDKDYRQATGKFFEDNVKKMGIFPKQTKPTPAPQRRVIESRIAPAQRNAGIVEDNIAESPTL